MTYGYHFGIFTLVFILNKWTYECYRPIKCTEYVQKTVKKIIAVDIL
jgi:hypothetical protein